MTRRSRQGRAATARDHRPRAARTGRAGRRRDPARHRGELDGAADGRLARRARRRRAPVGAFTVKLTVTDAAGLRAAIRDVITLDP